MKWFIASDIHGSAFFCSQLLAAYRQEKADHILLLGDLLYHGPRNALPAEYDPKAVSAMLNEYKDSIVCVRGNCDTEVDQMMLDFPIMAEYVLLCMDPHTIIATHGHKFNQAQKPPMKPGDILLSGHTHIPKYDTEADCLFVNPGSVSIPKANSEHSYMTFDGHTFCWKSLNGLCYRQLNLREIPLTPVV